MYVTAKGIKRVLKTAVPRVAIEPDNGDDTEMESKEMDRGCTGTPPPIIMALPVQLSPHETLRVPSYEHVLLHTTDSGYIQMCDDEYLPPSLTEALAVDSSSEIDESEDYDAIDLRQILEEEVVAEDVELLQGHERVPENVITWCENFDEFTGVEECYHEQSGPTIQETSFNFKIYSRLFGIGMEMIVDQTNKYTWQIIARASEDGISNGSRLNDWDETTVEELYHFFSILIYMSLCKRGRLDEYWTTGVLGLARFLKNRRTDVVGTLNRNRLETPSNIKNLNERQMQSGDIVAAHCGNVSVVAWKDVKLMITDFVTGRRPISMQRSQAMDKQVVKWISKGHHSLRMVDEPELKKLFEMSSFCELPANKRQRITHLDTEVIPKFDPAKKNVNVKGWLHKIDQLGDIYNWEERDRVFVMQTRLRGAARDWYDDLEDYSAT
ncbi:unnamed protein product [Arctia plantaginis]|uniref:PiggyBac transposable element-derived protein domain-containing protein n=1 Tax=Arctia plantaginis TaxID=874455 RepID=A0A8S0ZFD2_ARCPL|nr:unnamed protein product [Arctia plantaginis]CAB3252453.1 unnamed protein product [Arctia plantaginis]